jgi:hypothetical protein
MIEAVKRNVLCALPAAGLDYLHNYAKVATAPGQHAHLQVVPNLSEHLGLQSTLQAQARVLQSWSFRPIVTPTEAVGGARTAATAAARSASSTASILPTWQQQVEQIEQATAATAVEQ